MEKALAKMKEGRSAFKILIDKPTRKRPLGRPTHRLEDNIRMHLKEHMLIQEMRLIRFKV